MSAAKQSLRGFLRVLREARKTKPLGQAVDDAATPGGLGRPAAKPTREPQAPVKPQEAPEAPPRTDGVDETPEQAPGAAQAAPEPNPAPESAPSPEYTPVDVDEAGRMVEAARRPRPEDPTTNINFDRLQDADSLAAMVDEAAQYVPRGARTTVAEMGESGTRKVKEGDWTVTQMLEWDPESGLPMPDEVAANRVLLLTLGKQLKGQADLINVNSGVVGDEQLATFRMNVAKYKAALEVVQKQTRMAGQMLNQFKFIAQDVGVLRHQQMLELLSETGGRDTAFALAKHIAEEGGNPAKLAKIADNSALARSVRLVEGYRYNSMLSGFATHERNIMGNALVLLSRFPERLSGAAVSKARKLVNRVLGRKPAHTSMTDGITFMEVAGELDGAVRAIPEGIMLAWQALKDPNWNLGPSKLDQTLPTLTDALPRGKTGQKVRQVVEDNIIARGAVATGDFLLFNMATRGLQAGDVFFKAINFRASAQGAAIRMAANEGLSGDAMVRRVQELTSGKMPADIYAQSFEDMGRHTFTNALGAIGTGLGTIRAKYPPLKVVVPFYKTLVNITKWAGQRTVPANMLAFLNPETRAMVRAGGAEADEYFGRAAMWGLLGTTFYQAANNGHITGTGACLNDRTRKQWMKNGWKPLSFVDENGQYRPMKSGAPMTVVVGFYASLGECADLNDDPAYQDAMASAMTEAAFILAQTVGTQSFASDLLTYLDALVSPSDYKMQRIAESAAGQYYTLPNWLMQFESSVDPAYTEVDVGGALERLNARARSRIPWANDGYPPRRGFFGQVVEKPGGPLNVFPQYPVEKGWEYTTQMVLNDVGINYPEPKMSLGGQRVNLNDYEQDLGPGQVYDDWARLLGEARYTALADMVSSRDWGRTEPGKPGAYPGSYSHGDLLLRALSIARKTAAAEMADLYQGTEIGDLFGKEVKLGDTGKVPLDPGAQKRMKKEQEKMSTSEVSFR